MKPYVEKKTRVPVATKLKVGDIISVYFDDDRLAMTVIAIDIHTMVIGGYGLAITFMLGNKKGWDIIKGHYCNIKEINKGTSPVSVSDFTYSEYANTTEEAMVQPGERFSTANNDFVVEYVCEDGSLVMKSTKKPRDGKMYNPVMTLVCANDTNFSNALKNTRLVWK